jgi:hypothetical protein
MNREPTIDVEDLRRLGILEDHPIPKSTLLKDLRPASISEIPERRQEDLLRHLTLGSPKANIVVGGERVNRDPESPIMKRLRGDDDEENKPGRLNS